MSVIVYTENWDGKFKKLSFELASYASKLAEMFNTEPIAISIGSIGEEELKKLANYGIKKIITVKDEMLQNFDSRTYTKVIADICAKESGQIIVMANNNSGKSLAPRLSVRLKAAICSAAHELPESITPFVIKKRVFSGGALARTELKTGTKIITLAQNSFDLCESPADVTIESFVPDLEGTGSAITVKDQDKQTGKVLLADAEIVVSGGRGMKSPDNWAPLEELANLLDGATACSRPVSDEGWRPHEEHTGQTGKIIAPNVYFAIGISGATQHLAGISSSKYIVAINNDKDAPIFEAAQYGIVGDAAKILPQLVEAVKEFKAS
jgi:electron transfer flavoprotein alpha subunit